MDAQVGQIDRTFTAQRRVSDTGTGLSLGLVIAILMAVTLLTRGGEFNNPLTSVDEQFYFYMGKEMVRGALPYVDIWDRKPIGLFVIYEAIAALGGDGVLVTHLAAAAAAFATSIAIYALASRFAPRAGALGAGIAYLALLPTLGGGGGQSPVFYNLLIAVAALLTLEALRPGTRRWPLMAGAMALAGLAIQVKPTTLFEGAFFATAAMVAEWREQRSASRVAGLAGAMAAIASFPSFTAFGAYAAIGHFHDMWFATVVSIFKRPPLNWIERVGDVPQILLFLTVPALAAGSALRTLISRRGWDPVTLFLVGWCVAATVGFVAVPNFFNHYALPLIVPLCVAMAPLLGDRRDGLLTVVLIALVPILFEAPALPGMFRRSATFDRTAATIRQQLHGGCLYVHYGPTQLYTATDACHASPYVFPDHLEGAFEAGALPVSPETEVERLFATAPTVVVTGRRRFLSRNRSTAAIVERQLACHYRLLESVPFGGGQLLDIWTRRAGPLRCATASSDALRRLNPS